MMEIPTMLTIKQTAEMTKLPEHYIRQLCISGKISCVKAGVKNLINLQKLIEYFDNPSEKSNTNSPADSGTIRRIEVK